MWNENLHVTQLAGQRSYCDPEYLVVTWKVTPQMGIISWTPLGVCYFSRGGCTLGFFFKKIIKFFFQLVQKNKKIKNQEFAPMLTFFACDLIDKLQKTSLLHISPQYLPSKATINATSYKYGIIIHTKPKQI